MRFIVKRKIGVDLARVVPASVEPGTVVSVGCGADGFRVAILLALLALLALASAMALALAVAILLTLLVALLPLALPARERGRSDTGATGAAFSDSPAPGLAPVLDGAMIAI